MAERDDHFVNYSVGTYRSTDELHLHCRWITWNEKVFVESMQIFAAYATGQGWYMVHVARTTSVDVNRINSLLTVHQP